MEPQDMQLVTEKAVEVTTKDGVTTARLESGRTQMVPRGTKAGDSVRYAKKNPQFEGRPGPAVLGPWSWDPRAGQDLSLPLGSSGAPAATFQFQARSRTLKRLGRLNLEVIGDSPAFISEVKVAGDSLICSSRPATGHQIPAAAFDPEFIGQSESNMAGVLTPPTVDVLIQGGFLNAQTDVVVGGWDTDLVSAEEEKRFHEAPTPSQGLGNINWLFGLEPVQIAPGAVQTLRGSLARKPCTLGQLVLQASEPGAVNALLPRARGLIIEDISVAGYPLFSGEDSLGAGPFSYDSGNRRGGFIGKRLTSEQQEVTVTVRNDTQVTLDVLGAVWCL